MKRILLLLLLVASAAKIVFAQQDAMFTHYMFNQVIYNPAFNGIEKKNQFCANLVQRNQWMGFNPTDGSTPPVTTTFNLHTPIGLKKNRDRFYGVGLNFINDGLGFEYSTFATGAFAYHYKLNNGSYLSGGLNFGIVQKGIGEGLVPIDKNDPNIPAPISDVVIDMGIGFLYTAKDYFVGLSVMHLPKSSYTWLPGVTDSNFIYRTTYLTGGYDYIINPDLTLKPRALIKFDKAKWQFDLGSLIEYKAKYWGGLNYRRNEGFMVLGGLVIRNTKKDQLKLGVSYDITTNELRKHSNGSLELMLNYCFRINLKSVPPIPEVTPRKLNGYIR